MPATKKARRVRARSEFDMQSLLQRMQSPRVSPPSGAWEIPAILAARGEQMAGRFRSPVRLAEAMRTDDAIFVARSNRLAPLQALGVSLTAGKGPRADSVAGEGAPLFGEDGMAIRKPVVADLNGTLADHAVAVGFNVWKPRRDGSRVDVELMPWPLEHVWWDETKQTLMTTQASGAPMPITHGDGRWVVFKSHEVNPWWQNAAILSACIVWAGHAFAVRDWARGSASHGNAKPVGTLPEGISLMGKDEDGNVVPTNEAAAFLDLLIALVADDSPVGIMQAGSKLDYLVNSSKAWEVWERFGLNRERAAARIYLGTDGTLGATGGAPGIDVTALFGVATTKVQGDLLALTSGFQSGTIEPWAAINFGDSSAAPIRAYVIPDPDDQATRLQSADRHDRFQTIIKTARENGFAVTQEYVDCLASELGIDPPTLASQASSGTTYYGYEIDAGIPTIDEARLSKGLPPRADGKGALTVPELKASAIATSSDPTPPAAAPPAQQ